jgi:hypothetical protein
MYWAARERVRTVFLRARAEADMDEELRFHLEMEADKLARSEGLSREEARRRAGVAFGGVERFKGKCATRADSTGSRARGWISSSVSGC